MRFLQFINESTEEIDLKNTNIGVSMRVVTSEDLNALVTDATSEFTTQIKVDIVPSGNSTTFSINPMVPCINENIKAISSIFKEMINKGIESEEVQLFLQNKAMTESSIAWFYFQFCVNLAATGSANKGLKKIIEDKEQFPFEIFKNQHINTKLINTLKKLDRKKNIAEIISTLKDTSQFNISPVKDSSGVPIVSLKIRSLKELRNCVSPIGKIKNLLSVYKAAQEIDSSDSFDSIKAFEDAFSGNIPKDDPNAKPSKDKDSKEDDNYNVNDPNYQRSLEKEVGQISYKIDKKTQQEFLGRYPFMDSPEASGEVSIRTDLPHRPFTFTGTWNSGEWNGDDSFMFQNSEWNGGKFNGGFVFKSEWNDGEFVKGKFYKSVFNKGTFSNGTFMESIFNGGTFSGGTFEDGSKWQAGEWVSGTWKDGKIWSTKYRTWIKSFIDPATFKKAEDASWTVDKLVKIAQGEK